MNVSAETFDNPELRRAWKDMCSRDPRMTVFQTLEWNEAWWGAFGATQPERALLLLVAWEGSELAGIIPLFMQSRRFAGRTLWQYALWIADELSPYPRAIADAYHTADVWRSVLEWFSASHPQSWLFLRDCSIEDSLVLSCGHPASFNVIPGQSSTNLSLALKESEQMLASATPSMRRSLRRALDASRDNTSITWSIERGVTARSEAIIADLCRLRFGRHSFFESESNRIFFSNLREAFGRSMFISSIIEHDRPVHALAGFFFETTCYYFLAGFDESSSAVNPGFLNFFHLMEYARESGCDRFDFLRGTERFKREFGSVEEESRTVTVVPHSAAHRFAFARALQNVRQHAGRRAS